MHRELENIEEGRVLEWGRWETGPRSLFELASKTFYKTRWYQAFSDSLEILHPKILEECMRDIAEERAGDMPWKPILYSCDWGGFGFSDSFLTFIGFEDCRRDIDSSNMPQNDSDEDNSFSSERRWKRGAELSKKERHVYDSVVAFGNLIMHKAPDMVAECDIVRKGLNKAQWEKEWTEQRKKSSKPSLPNLRYDRWRTIATEMHQEFHGAQAAFKQDFQNRLTAIIQREPDLRQWYGCRRVSLKIEKAGLAGLKLAASDGCDMAVKWVPPMAVYRISDYDGMESVKWWFTNKHTQGTFWTIQYHFHSEGLFYIVSSGTALLKCRVGVEGSFSRF